MTSPMDEATFLKMLKMQNEMHLEDLAKAMSSEKVTVTPDMVAMMDDVRRMTEVVMKLKAENTKLKKQLGIKP